MTTYSNAHGTYYHRQLLHLFVAKLGGVGLRGKGLVVEEL